MSISTFSHESVTINELPVGSVLCVKKGCPTLGITKGQRAVVDEIERERVSHGGYRVHLCLGDRSCWLYAANSARLTGENISLNNGNPLYRVVLVRRSI